MKELIRKRIKELNDAQDEVITLEEQCPTHSGQREIYGYSERIKELERLL